jgi:SAM-dependent methyltransferase
VTRPDDAARTPDDGHGPSELHDPADPHAPADGGPGAWDGDDYQRRVEELTAADDAPHGEADLVGRYAPRHVLDAGCGTGRVAIELHRRGTEVVGVDVDPSMLSTARRLAPDQTWIEADLATLDLGRTFDIVLLAGNVPLFTPPGTHAALVAACARHVAPGGKLIAGFSLGSDYRLTDWDGHATAAGLRPVERWSTWDRDPFTDDAGYVVTMHTPA